MTRPKRRRPSLIAWLCAYLVFGAATALALGSYAGAKRLWEALAVLAVSVVPAAWLSIGLIRRRAARARSNDLALFETQTIRLGDGRAAEASRDVAMPSVATPMAMAAGGRHTATPFGVGDGPRYGQTRFEPIDWDGFVLSMAIRIEEALGPGFFAHGHECTLILSHADATQRVECAGLLRSYPHDPTQGAMQACTKMLDCAQMFKMQQLRQPWPRRPFRDDSSPATTLARPRVELRDFELHMAFVDELGVVLRLPSLPFVEGHPEPDGPVRLG